MALSNAERQRRYRERRRKDLAAAERARTSRREYMRDRRAAAREQEAADRPPAPGRPAGLVEFAQRLTVTQGEHVDQALTVLPWQAEYLRRVEAMAGGELGLSVPAGAGKTTLAATVAAAAVVGPLAQPRAAVILVAASFTQALIGFDHVHAFMQPELLADGDRWRVLRSEQAAVIEDRLTGVQLRAREANARTLHGSAPSLILADEPAQWAPTQRDRLYSALRSRLGKVPGARLLAIGTRPDDPEHWFARLLQRPGGAVYAADPDADPFEASTWEAANPSLAHFPALRAVYEREAAEAEADPSLLPSFKALRLNQGTADHEIAVLVEAERWEACEVDLLPAARGPAVWGVDLSGGAAMAAVSCYWPRCGRLEALAAFPELPSLVDRGRADGADYQRMADEGDLLVLGGKGSRVVPVAALIGEALERWGRPVRIVADHHQERELRQELGRASFPPAALVTTGMGWHDGPGRIRDFRRSVNGGKVWALRRLLIRQALGNARTVSDSMGSEKVIKGGAQGRKRTARDDVAVASLLAISEGSRLPKPARARRSWVV